MNAQQLLRFADAAQTAAGRVHNLAAASSRARAERFVRAYRAMDPDYPAAEIEDAVDSDGDPLAVMYEKPLVPVDVWAYVKSAKRALTPEQVALALRGTRRAAWGHLAYLYQVGALDRRVVPGTENAPVHEYFVRHWILE